MINYYTYKIPFKQNLVLGNQVISEREGLLVHFRYDDRSIWTEIAPLPGFSSETLDEVKAHLERIKKDLELEVEKCLTGTYTEDTWYDWVDAQVLPASCRFGLDILYQALKANQSGMSLRKMLNPQATDRVGCNALIGIMAEEAYPAAIEQAVQDGFRTIKFKIQDPSTLVTVLGSYRKAYPDLHFRFDANGSWPLEKAFEWANVLASIHPEYLEQPFKKGQEHAMAKLQAHIDFPLAADESCTDLASMMHIHERNAANRFILKPALLGSLREIRHMIDWLSDRHIPFTMTTLLESGVARNWIYSLCAAWADPNTDHGLNTGTLFERDLLKETNRGKPSQIIIDDSVPMSKPDPGMIYRF